jgi:hypothetical protein
MTAPILSLPTSDNEYHKNHVLLMLNNLRKWTSYDLVADCGFPEETLGEQILNADFYILSHNGSQDPILNYANKKVLELWEVSWEELTSMYARDTAKADNQMTREKMMKKVREQNYVSGYSGLRISKTGKEFKILDVTIWNLFTDTGDPYGQAAWFKRFEYL